MEAPAIRRLIRDKLKDGRLPCTTVCGDSEAGPGNGERCDACDALVSQPQLVMEGIASTPSDKKPIQFHVVCFQLWDAERRAPQLDHRPNNGRSRCAV
jgi:hypothetical protein